MFWLGLLAGAVVGGLVMVFVVNANPKIILSAKKISDAYDSIKDLG